MMHPKRGVVQPIPGLPHVFRKFAILMFLTLPVRLTALFLAPMADLAQR